MKNLIVYASKYGCTEKCVNKLNQYLKSPADIINLNSYSKDKDISAYDTVIIGGPIMVGKINQKVKNFYEANMEALLKKKIGLFVCAGDEKGALKELKDNVPDKLFEAASVKGYFGYEYNFEKMNIFLKAMIKKMAKVEQNVSNILEENIKEFASEIEK